MATCHISNKTSCSRDSVVKAMPRPDLFLFFYFLFELVLFYLHTGVCTQLYSHQSSNVFQVWTGCSKDVNTISPIAVGATAGAIWKRGRKSACPQIMLRQRYVCTQVQSAALPVPLETRPFYLSSSRARGNVGYATTTIREMVKDKTPLLYSHCLSLVNLSCWN